MGDRKLAGIAAADIGHVHSAFSGGDRISSAVRSALPASISPVPRWLRRARVGQA
jgi:hypothetical protein